MLIQNNPTYQGFVNPWQDQGDYIEPTGGYSTEEDAPGGIWDWWNDNGEQATDFAKSVLCLIKPEKCRPQNNGQPQTTTQPQNNTFMFVFLALIVLLLIVVIFKK